MSSKFEFAKKRGAVGCGGGFLIVFGLMVFVYNNVFKFKIEKCCGDADACVLFSILFIFDLPDQNSN